MNKGQYQYLTEQEQAQYDKIQSEQELAEEDAIQAQQKFMELWIGFVDHFLVQTLAELRYIRRRCYSSPAAGDGERNTKAYPSGAV